MVFVSRLGFAAQEPQQRLTEQDSAHKTAADLTPLGDGGVRVAVLGGAAAGGEGRAGLRVAA
jgi:hypothetical protein